MSHGDRYLRLLCVLLLGYALMGKGFAYIGIPPFYVGELLMLYGLVALMLSPDWSRVLRTAWLWPVFALMAWGALRTIPYLQTDGVDALHDAAVWIWGIYAIVISSLLAADPTRLKFLESKFRVFAKLLLLLAPVFYVITVFGNTSLPRAFWADVPYVLIKGGDIVVHLIGILAFAILVGGLQPFLVVPMTIVNLLLCFTGRASIVTFGTGAGILVLMRPKSTILWGILATLIIGVTVMWVLNIQISVSINDPVRNISADQIVKNVQSIFSDVDDDSLAGTKQWRLKWWDSIIQYTVHGKYFWGGKGFGVNLADDDGFQVEADHSLRSPHNGHLTMLARGGVPMLAIWALCQLTLGYGLASAAYQAHRRKDQHWFGLLVFLLIYWVAFLINASFDVFLEGPVGGIWFWTVYGVALGAVWIYRNCPDALDATPKSSKAVSRQSRYRARKLAGMLGG